MSTVTGATFTRHVGAAAALLMCASSGWAQDGGNLVISEADCNSAKLGTAVSPRLIGEPVSAVTLDEPVWVPATETLQAYCRVNGGMAPIDVNAPPIRFSVALPSSWAFRAAHVGGGGNNGSIPSMTAGGHLARGWAVLGSDSGHQNPDTAWAVNDESMMNFGYMQLKKTHDAAWVLIRRMYGKKPVFSYFFGNSQGGREALTVAQRYPADYDGVVATVPVVDFSNLTLSRALHRIQEIPLANWVTTAKRTAISTEVVRRCDGLDGLYDGVVNNYMACRRLFDVTRGDARPWAAKQCPDDVDPNPADTTASACLTSGQQSTLEFVQRRYHFATPLANGNPSFGMWVPNTDPGGSGMIVTTRYVGQEGAAENAPVYSWLGAPFVVGGLFQDLAANPLDYVEGGPLNDRRELLSSWLDSTNPDLRPFMRRGGKLIVMVGTFDSLASSGAQLDYYESVVQTMGRARVDRFARLYVLPNTGHGLTGSSYPVDGLGRTNPSFGVPSAIDRTQMIIDWVERGVAPPMSAEVTSGSRSLPLCSYPQYPRFLGGDLPPESASSYQCAE